MQGLEVDPDRRDRSAQKLCDGAQPIALVSVVLEESTALHGAAAPDAIEDGGELRHHLAFGDRTVEVKQQIAETDTHESALHHLERRPFLGDE